MSLNVLNTTANLTGKTLMAAENAETITGVKTFSAKPVINAGLKFPAVQVPDADVNTLDDYEEGTYTPALTSSGGGAATYSAQTGTYVKVGRQVQFCGRITLATKGTLAAGTLTVALPFTGSPASQVSIPYFGAMTTGVSGIGAFVQGAAFALTYVPAVGALGVSFMTVADISGTVDIIFGGTLYV